jgi:hypothetical protein
MEKMTDDELQGIVARAIEDAEDYVQESVGEKRKHLTDYYDGKPFAGHYGITEKEGQSQFVSRDVHDTVHKILPSLIETFLGSERVVEFLPRRGDLEPLAKQATDYVNYIIREDNDGFSVLYAAIKDALYQIGGIIKYWWDETPVVEYDDYSGLSPDQFIALNVPGVEILDAEQDEEAGLISCQVRRKLVNGRIRIAAVPPEEFSINRTAVNIATANDCWHSCEKTVSELVAMGYDEAEMLELAGNGHDDDTGERYARNEYGDEGNERSDPGMRLVRYHEGYIRVDYDGDGIAELRQVCAAGPGKKILRNKPANYPQFVCLASDPTPHTFFGSCPGEAVMDIQRGKSQTMRLALDSMVQQVHPRTWAVDGQVNMDDLLSAEIGGVVRTRAPGMVGEIATGNSATMALGFLQHYNEVREERTGQSKASAGLDADSLQSTTKAAVEMTRQASQQRIKIIVRLLAEGGFKPLFKGILRLIHRHQDQARTVQLRGEYVAVDPRQYDPTMDVTVNVGMGAGNVDERRAFLMGTLQTQQTAFEKMGLQNPIVDMEGIYNTLDDLARLHDKQVSRYFKKPPPNWQPEPPQPQPNPLVEAEKIKAEFKFKADMAKLAADQDLERDKIVVDAVNEAIKLGLPADALEEYAMRITAFITRPRMDQGTQMGGQ